MENNVINCSNIVELPVKDLEIKRFGHTLTLINNNEVALYGGAKSINELYNDAYIYNIKEKSWLKLNPLGDIPSARAAHAACCKDSDNIIIFGGVNQNGGYASNELYILEICQEKTSSKWKIIPCRNNKPPRRYGHSLIFIKPFILVFGGILKSKNRLANDVWVLNTEKNYLEGDVIFYEWNQIEFKNLMPCPRMYHTLGICKSGKAKGMILLFGGRNDKNIPLNDAWGLRKHRNGSWEWILAPNLNKIVPIKRFQHSSIFYSNYMIILGGVSDAIEDIHNGGIPIEIYNCNSSEWSSHINFNKFRHASFLIAKYAFTFGGCEYNNPLEPTNKMDMFDVEEICKIIKKYVL